MPPLKAQLLLEDPLSAYFPEMVFTDSGITVQLHRNTQLQLRALWRYVWQGDEHVGDNGPRAGGLLHR